MHHLEAEATDHVLAFRGVSLVVNTELLVEDIDLKLSKGEINALVGGADSAKSAICSLAAGETTPTKGDVIAWFGKLEAKKRKEMMNLGIVKIPKTPQLFPHLTVAQNLVAGIARNWRENWVSWKKRYLELEKWLAVFGLDLPGNLPLSYYPRENWLFIQMLGILFRRPKLLILDETLELLPPEQRGQIWPILLEQTRNGMTVLWATQNLDDALNYSSRIAVLYEQRILLTSATNEIDRLSLFRICYGLLPHDGDTTLEQFHQMLCFTEAALSDLPTGVIVVDSDLTIRFANRSATSLFMDHQPGMIGAALSGFTGSRNGQLMDIIRKAVVEAEQIDGDVEWRSQPYAANSENKQVDVRVRHIREGAIRIGYLIVMEDVSLREELQRQLILSENMASIGLLAAGVAHEVNNPLAIIGNYNDYLKGKVNGDGPAEATQQIETQSKRIQQIMHSLTAISSSRVDGRVPIDLYKLADDLCNLIKADASRQDLSLACGGKKGECLVLGDPNEIRLVVLNLLRNAIDAIGPEPGSVHIEIGTHRWEDQDAVRLKIRDTGPGIFLADLNHVFLPFVSTKKENGVHQGLGLAIVHRIVNKYKGAISAENIVTGGCQFIIHLPRFRPVGS